MSLRLPHATRAHLLLAGLPALGVLSACRADAGLTKYNSDPEAEITAPVSGTALTEGTTVTLRGAAADANHDASELTARWFAGAAEACGAAPPAVDGTTTCDVLVPEGDLLSVRLEVLDPDGAVGTASVDYTVVPNAAPEAAIERPTADGVYYADQFVTLRALVSDVEDAPEALSVRWESNRDGALGEVSPNTEGLVESFVALTEGAHALQLFVTDTNGNEGQASVLIDVGPPNSPPDCAITEPSDGAVGEEGGLVTFRAAVSDPDIAPDRLSVTWTSDKDGTLGSSTPTSDGTVTFPYADLSMDTHVVSVQVVDELGASCTAEVVYTVGSPPDIEVTSPATGDVVNEGDVVTLTALVSDGEDLPADLTVTWESDLDGLLDEAPPDSDGTSEVLITGLSAGEHLLTATVWDTDGLYATDRVVLEVNGLPSAPSVTITPSLPDTDDDLRVGIVTDAVDPEGATLTYAYVWSVDGVPSSASRSATLPASATTRGETWRVSVTADDGLGSGAAGAASVTIGNSAPSVSGLVLTPDPAYEDDVLSCSAGTTADADGDTVGLTYEWYVDGVALGLDTDTVDGASFDRGDEVTCTVTPTDGTDDGAVRTSNTVTIGNSAPVVASVSIAPEDPTAASTLTCAYAGYADADGDADASTITWTVDGVVVGTGAELAGAFVGGDVVTCTATPYDGTDTGSDVSASVTIGNTAPTLGTVSITPSTAYNDDTLTCSSTATDADGGAVAMSYVWSNTSSGVSLGSGATLRLSSTVAASRDTIVCTVTASDADGATDIGTASITLENRAPLASAALTPVSPTRASELTCTGTASDADDDTSTLSFAWTVDGTAAAASSSTATQSTLAGAFGAGQSVACTVTATDGKSGTGSDTASVIIGNTAPVVASVTLSPGSVYTNDTLTASVVASDPDGDTLSTTYDWYVDGALVLSGTDGALSGSDYFDRDETVTVTVTAYDGVDAASMSSAPVTVLNSAPSLPSIALSPSDAEAGDDLVCDVTTGSTDADGDAVTYSFDWAVEGSAHGGATDEPARSTVDGADVGPEETWTCAVTAFDGTDGSDPATASVTTTCLEGSQAACPGTSCLDILDAGASSGDGTYWIDPLGAGAYEVLCDMATDGGGWTAVMKAVGGNFAYDDAVWTSSALYNTTDLDPTASGNAKYQSFNEVPFDTIRSSSTTTWSSGIDYTFSSTQDSALALFSGAGIDVARTRSSYFNAIVPADEQSWNCSTYDAYGFNMLSYLGTSFLGGGSYCDWNGGARWGNRANAYHSGTGNHSGQGWGAYSTICPPYATSTACTFAISQVMWVR